jgi:hypothetical protein
VPEPGGKSLLLTFFRIKAFLLPKLAFSDQRSASFANMVNRLPFDIEKGTPGSTPNISPTPHMTFSSTSAAPLPIGLMRIRLLTAGKQDHNTYLLMRGDE